jgi:pimeloyl-ACP methyl ester carboxylesterase
MLAYEKAGAGPPLLLMHGLGSCKEMWRPVVPLLAREREVVTLDLPGFGASPAGPLTVDGLADAVAEFAAGLGYDRPHVAGNSMGGGIALALAASGQARSACAVSPIGFANDREAAYARTVLAITRVLSTAATPVATALTRTAALRTALMSHTIARAWRLPGADAALWIRACAGATAFWDLLRNAPGWDAHPPVVPTTVAWGDRDRLLIYSRQAPRARRRLPGAQHVTLAGCGHVPTWDDPEQVAAVILEASREA